MNSKNDARPKLDRVKRKGHVIDLQIAAVHGMPAAGVYWHISYLLDMNNAQRDHIDEEGVPWMYQSLGQIASHMPYLTVDQVKTALQLLKKEGLIISKAHPNKFVKSLGYTLAPDQWLPKIAPIDGVKLPHGRSKITPSAGPDYSMYIPYGDSYEDSYEENTNTHAALGFAPTSSSHLCQSEGVSSIGDGDAEPECSPRPRSCDSRGGQPQCGIKTPPPSLPPLKTRKTGRPVDPSKSPSQPLPDFPLVAISIEEREKLAAKHTPGVMAGVYEWYSGWKESKMQCKDHKMLDKSTDYWRLTNWAIKAYRDRMDTEARFSAPQRKGHIHADEVAMKELKARTAGLSAEAAMIVEGKMSLEECLRTYRVHGSPNLDEIREVFPEYTGDGS